MPSIITDDMVKEMCKMSRPIPIQAIGVLDPNKKVGAKPNFIRKKGRTGIKPVELPIYAPANINGLVQSICNITKLEPEVVENYLDNAITQELGEYTGTQEDIEISFDADQMPIYEDYADVQEGAASETPIELFDTEIQTRASFKQGTKPLREGKLEEGVVMNADPNRFVSSGGGVVPASDTAEVGTGDIDVTDPRGRQGGVVGRPRLRGSSRRADGEPEL